jgi:hypothetical protein
MKLSGLFILSCFLLPACVFAADNKRIITAEQWAVPRSAETLITMPALRDTIHEMQALPGNRLLVRHPSGDEGILWVSELRSWLVSLGISSQSIELIPGTEQNHIELDVIQASFDSNQTINNNSRSLDSSGGS